MGSGFWNMVPEPRKGGEKEEDGRREEYGFRLLNMVPGLIIRRKKKKKEEEESMGSGYWNMVPEPRKGIEVRRKKKKDEESMGSGYWNMVPEPRKGREGRRMKKKKKRRVWVPAT